MQYKYSEILVLGVPEKQMIFHMQCVKKGFIIVRKLLVYMFGKATLYQLK
jgi:hypothetical protein